MYKGSAADRFGVYGARASELLDSESFENDESRPYVGRQ